MAPSKRPGSDPNRIDVALQMVGADSAAVIQDLAKQVQSLNSFLNSQSGNSAESRAITAVNYKTNIRVAQGEASTPDKAAGVGRADIFSSGGVVLPSSAENLAASAGRQASRPPDPDPEAAKIAAMGFKRRIRERGLGNFVGDQMRIYGHTEREQQARRDLEGVSPNYENPGLATGSLLDSEVHGRGGPSENASTPPPMVRERGESDARFASRSNRTAWEQMQEGQRMPQFGELTIQDKLYMASRFAGRLGEAKHQNELRRIEALPVGEQQAAYNELASKGPVLTKASLGLRMAGDVATEAQTIYRSTSSKLKWISDLQTAGTSAGYERGGVAFGVMNPVSEASREGLRQKWNTARLRMSGGINGQQAAEIVNSLAAEGFVGREGQDLAFDTVKPLVQQGQDASTVSEMLSKTIRNGASSVTEFREAMDKLGPAAKNARMSLDEYQKSLDGFAETMEGAGGTYLQRAQLGDALSKSTSLAPQQIAPLLNNPLVQGFAMRQGIFPHEMGLMSASGGIQSINGAVQMAMQASQGFNRDIEERDSKGNLTGNIIEGEDRVIAAAASQLGLNPDVVKKIAMNAKSTTAASDAISNLKAFKGALKGDGKTVPGRGGWKPIALSVGRGGSVGMVRGGTKEEQAMYDDLSDPNKKGTGGWGRAEDSLQEMVKLTSDPKLRKERQEKLDKINKISDLNERQKAATKFATDIQRSTMKADQSTDKVRVEFTGRADAFFKQVGIDDKKKNANSGGNSITDAATSVAGAIVDKYTFGLF